MNLQASMVFLFAGVRSWLADVAALPNDSNMLDPQAPQAQAMYHLGLVALVVFCLIFALVGGHLLWHHALPRQGRRT